MPLHFSDQLGVESKMAKLSLQSAVFHQQFFFPVKAVNNLELVLMLLLPVLKTHSCTVQDLWDLLTLVKVQ